MLTAYTSTGAATPLRPGAPLPPQAVWLDLIAPEPDEVAAVEQATGVHVPSRGDLSEIESSSRMRSEHGALYLSAPMVSHIDTMTPRVSPVGFVLTADHLITIRFEALRPFDNFIHGFADGGPIDCSGSVFAGLIEAIVDRGADVLEAISAELDAISHLLFRSSFDEDVHRPARHEKDLRNTLRRIGSNGDLASTIRDSLLAIARIVPYVEGNGAAWLSAEVKPRLETVRHDVSSLSDYDAHLVNKTQFLLDATLGMINIEQNNIIKVLTIVSVVGVPPTLVASMYGMNFHNMPELDWAWGYPYGLTLIALSAVLPLAWFRWRGWF